MDRVSKAVRSRIMSRIRGKDTEPELRVRRFLHAAGLRYRLHVGSLPGKPDIVFPSRGVCVFVHGCFWHGCRKCEDGRRRPKSNQAYWGPKIRRNRERDRKNSRALVGQGWQVYEVWACEIVDAWRLEELVRAIRQ